MSFSLAAAFVAACVLLALTPGPNMSLIIAATLSAGFRAGLLTLLGCLTGLVVLVTVAALGMTSVMVLMSTWFDIVRWAGAVYLVYLGFRQLRAWWYPAPAGLTPPVVSARSRWAQGFTVSLSNPKVLLFLGAFFPQFVDPAFPPGPQLAVLATLFVGTLAAVDLAYTVAVAEARSRFDPRRLRALDAIAGVLLMAGGLVLATMRRP